MDLCELGLLTVQIDALEALEATQTVPGVDHEVAHCEFIHAAERGLLEGLSGQGAALLLTEQLICRDDREARSLRVEAVVESTDPHAQLLWPCELTGLLADGVEAVGAQEGLNAL